MNLKNGRLPAGTKVAITLRLPNGNGLRFCGDAGNAQVFDREGRFTMNGFISGAVTTMTKRWPKGRA